MDIYTHQTKSCYKCKAVKSIYSYSKDSSKLDGLQARCKSCAAEYKKSNKSRLNLHRSSYDKIRKLNDPLFKLRANIRSLINLVLRRRVYTIRSKIYVILGCTYSEFEHHLESQFVEGMSWNNRELWQIDHVVPVSLGQTEEEIIRLNHYTNLRPLWSAENRRKSNRYIG